MPGGSASRLRRRPGKPLQAGALVVSHVYDTQSDADDVDGEELVYLCAAMQRLLSDPCASAAAMRGALGLAQPPHLWLAQPPHPEDADDVDSDDVDSDDEIPDLVAMPIEFM